MPIAYRLLPFALLFSPPFASDDCLVSIIIIGNAHPNFRNCSKEVANSLLPIHRSMNAHMTETTVSFQFSSAIPGEVKGNPGAAKKSHFWMEADYKQ